MIDQAKMEAALAHLAQSDYDYAEAKTAVLNAEILRKRVRSRVLLTTTGNVAERNAQAEVHSDVIEADEDYSAAYLVYERLRASRQRAELVCELFRTLEASRRKG